MMLSNNDPEKEMELVCDCGNQGLLKYRGPAGIAMFWVIGFHNPRPFNLEGREGVLATCVKCGRETFFSIADFN